jgi:hypothetical protein
MLEIVIAQIPGKCQVFFNISGNVGLRSPNDTLDVQLVQLGYACAAINPANSAPQDVKALWQRVSPGSPYTGTAQDILTQAIAAHERIKGISQDGHISRMAGGQLRHAGPRGSEPFLLSNLCNNIFDILSSTYPRIDLSPKCPPGLGAHIKNLFRN